MTLNHRKNMVALVTNNVLIFSYKKSYTIVFKKFSFITIKKFSIATIFENYIIMYNFYQNFNIILLAKLINL